MVDVIEFRNAMSLLSSAVSVVTTAGQAGQHGFTASAICSVTDTPPTLLVCMNTTSRSYEHFVKNKVLCVNVLTGNGLANHENLSNVFASRLSQQQRFEHGSWQNLLTGSPVLTDALVSFDCEIGQIQEVGTHGIFICPIVALQAHQQASEGQGLVYFNRQYHPIGEIKELLQTSF